MSPSTKNNARRQRNHGSRSRIGNRWRLFALAILLSMTGCTDKSERDKSDRDKSDDDSDQDDRKKERKSDRDGRKSSAALPEQTPATAAPLTPPMPRVAQDAGVALAPGAGRCVALSPADSEGRRVTVTLTIDAAGAVSYAAWKGDLPRPVADCLVKEALTLRFVPGQASTLVFDMAVNSPIPRTAKDAGMALMPGLGRCAASDPNPSALKDKRVTVTVNVDARGAVTKVELQGDMPAAVTTCLGNEAGLLVFVPTGEASTLVFSIAPNVQVK